jgi:hypothetical protein
MTRLPKLQRTFIGLRIDSSSGVALQSAYALADSFLRFRHHRMPGRHVEFGLRDLFHEVFGSAQPR